MESDRFVVTMIEGLNSLGVPYLLAGSFSSNYYGVPRSTKDADFVIQLGIVPVMRLKTVLPENFVLDPQVEFETVTGTLRNVVTVNQGEFKIELFRLSTDPHDQSRSHWSTSVLNSRTIQSVMKALNEESTPFMVVGSLSSNVYSH